MGRAQQNPNHAISEELAVVKAELGTKRTCPSCATRFYDLLRDPIVCPSCGVTFIAPTLLPSKTDLPAAAVAKPRPPVAAEPEEAGDVELVSLEDVEEPGEEDEAAAIEDVDLGEEAEATEEADDDTFLVEEEEEGGDMTGLIDGGPAAKEEGEEP
jgi:uncharacterized protein (TIGR02300 family)